MFETLNVEKLNRKQSHAINANYSINHMQGKITKMRLANEEGIFS